MLGKWIGRTSLPPTLAAAMLLLAGPAVSPAHGYAYHVVDLGGLPAGSGANSLSASGFAAGYQLAGPSQPHAVLFSNGATLDLGTFGGDASLANSVNASGAVVGWARLADATRHAFLYRDGVMRDLGTLGGSISVAYSVNDAGVVVGASYNAEDRVVVPFIWTDADGMRPIPAPLIYVGQANSVNASGAVAGFYIDTVKTHAFVYDHGNVITLADPGSIASKAYHISDNGLVVGFILTDEYYPRFHAAIWRDGVLHDFGALFGTHSIAYAVNNAGVAVGSSYLANDQMVATAYTERGGIVNLNDELPDSSGWLLEYATGITEEGVISGVGLFNGSARAFALVPRSLQNGPWGIPDVFSSLAVRAYPMPMRGEGWIELDLPAAVRGRVSLYDVGGRRLAELASGRFGPGRVQLPMSASLLGRIGPGVYFARFDGERGSGSRRFVVIP